MVKYIILKLFNLKKIKFIQYLRVNEKDKTTITRRISTRKSMAISMPTTARMRYVNAPGNSTKAYSSYDSKCPTTSGAMAAMLT